MKFEYKYYPYLKCYILNDILNVKGAIPIPKEDIEMVDALLNMKIHFPLALGSWFQRPSRHADTNHLRRQVFSDNAAGTNERTITNCNARQNNDSCSQPAVAPNFDGGIDSDSLGHVVIGCDDYDTGHDQR